MDDRQTDLFDDTYVLGQTKDADDTLWTPAGFGGPLVTELLGLSSPYRVTGKQALEQAAALICLDVLAQDISKATLRLKRKKSGGGEEIVEPAQHAIARMLALEPNRRHTWVEFVSMLIYHLGMASNSYAYIQRTHVDDPVELIPVMPMRVTDRINPKTREVFYEIYASTEHEIALLGATDIIARERDVLHVRQRLLDGFYGYATLAAGGRTLSLSRELDNYQSALYREDGMIRGVFVRPGDKGAMTDDVFRRTKSQLKKLMQRVRDHGDPILLEDGITYKELAMKANEAEMAKALDKQIEMICKLWRMPPHKAMHLNAVKYENLTAMEMVYVRDTLIPICRLIEARLGKALLSPDERLVYRLEFDRDEMAIADEKAALDEAVKLGERGFISHNEVREMRRFNPRKNGDVYTVPVNTVLVDENGNVVASGAKGQASEQSSGSQEADDKKAPSKALRLVHNG